MSTIPTRVTEEQFEQKIRPYLSVAKRGYVSCIPLYKIFNYVKRCVPSISLAMHESLFPFRTGHCSLPPELGVQVGQNGPDR